VAEELTFTIKLSDLVRDLGGFPLTGTRFRHEEAQWRIVSVEVEGDGRDADSVATVTAERVFLPSDRSWN